MGGKDSKPVFVTYEEALDRGIARDYSLVVVTGAVTNQCCKHILHKHQLSNCALVANLIANRARM